MCEYCLQALVSHAAKWRGTGQAGEMSAETVIATRSEGEMNHGHRLKKLQEGFNKKRKSQIHSLHCKWHKVTMKRTVDSTKTHRGRERRSQVKLPMVSHTK